MTVASAPFYWLTCDAPGCVKREPSGDEEVIAWGDVDGAIESAKASDWMAGDRDYCPDHHLFVCEKCGKLDLTPLPGERDYLCTTHASTLDPTEAPHEKGRSPGEGVSPLER